MCLEPSCSHPSERSEESPVRRLASGATETCPSVAPVFISSEIDLFSDECSSAEAEEYRNAHEMFMEFIELRRGDAGSYLDTLGNIATETAEALPAHHVLIPRGVIYSPRYDTEGGWMERVARSLVVRDALGDGTSRRYLGCGTLGTVWTRTNSAGYLEAKIHGSRCRCRVCPSCAKAYAKEVSDGIKRIYEAMEWPLLLTLTVKHSKEDSLQKLLDKLERGLNCLRRRPIWKDNVTGAVKVLEIKWSEENGWHPHLHMICDAKWIAYEKLRDTWLSITGDSSQVDIRRIKSSDKAARYITKYLTKSMDSWGDRQLFEFLRTMHGVRTVSTLGWCIKMPILDSHEKIKDEPEPNGDWTPLGSIDDVFKKAGQGDVVAIQVIKSLYGERAARRASPPPSKEQAKRSPPGEQTQLW
jgi:hypothetical protein